MPALTSEALKRLWVCEWHPVCGLAVIRLGDQIERNVRKLLAGQGGTGHETIAVFQEMEDAVEHNRALKSRWKQEAAARAVAELRKEGEEKWTAGGLDVGLTIVAGRPSAGKTRCRGCRKYDGKTEACEVWGAPRDGGCDEWDGR